MYVQKRIFTTSSQQKKHKIHTHLNAISFEKKTFWSNHVSKFMCHIDALASFAQIALEKKRFENQSDRC